MKQEVRASVVNTSLVLDKANSFELQRDYLDLWLKGTEKYLSTKIET